VHDLADGFGSIAGDVDCEAEPRAGLERRGKSQSHPAHRHIFGHRRETEAAAQSIASPILGTRRGAVGKDEHGTRHLDPERGAPVHALSGGVLLELRSVAFEHP
jgi:hypothetical protein